VVELKRFAVVLALLPLPSCVADIHGDVDVAYGYSGAICQPADSAVSASLVYGDKGVGNGGVGGAQSKAVTVVCPLVVFSADPVVAAVVTRISGIEIDYVDNTRLSSFSCSPWLTDVGNKVNYGEPRELFTCDSAGGCEVETSDQIGEGALTWNKPFGDTRKLEYRDLGVLCTIPPAGPDEDVSWVNAIKVTVTLHR
jgi:hypothetical protein